MSFPKTKNIKKREFFCQNLKSQKSVLLNNLVIRELHFVINANILGIAKRPHMEDYEFSKFQQKFCKFKSKFKHYKKKVPICFIKVHNLLRGIDNFLGSWYKGRGVSKCGGWGNCLPHFLANACSKFLRQISLQMNLLVSDCNANMYS